MIQLGISKQVIIIALLPTLIVAAILTTHYTWDQLDYLSESLDRNGKFMAKQLSPAAEFAVYSGNTEFIKPLVDTIIKNDSVLRIQILDKDNNSILDVKKPEYQKQENTSIVKKYLVDIFNMQVQKLVFVEPIMSAQISLTDETYPDTDNIEKHKTIENKSKTTDSNQIGRVIVTFTTKFTSDEQIEQIQHGILISLPVILLTTFIVIRLSRTITRPIKSLTQTVRNITSGDLNAHIELNSTGELGILESCINQMKNELKTSQTDLEIQLDVFTKELQETLEELEIRNAELDITRSKAIHASNAKSEFLANMSHEIRTPLSGIIGFTELLQGTPVSSQQKDYINTIEKSSTSLLQIINDILDLSKIESGKTVISSSEFSIIDIIEDIINLLSPAALDKNIELFYRIENNVPNTISSDPFRIHQILTNLIGNAIKFTEQGYVYLQVTTDGSVAGGHAHYEPNEVSVRFSISDTGIGMNKNDKLKLFKAFTQADTSITRRFGGTGLGLVISRKLTLLMNGEMDFDSTEGKGSIFWFCIPVTPIPEAFKKPGGFNSELANKKIAFICSHFIARQAFTTLFNNEQCTVKDYSFNELINHLGDIEQNNDAIILFLSRVDINKKNTSKNLNKLKLSKPSFLIASTRSYKKLRNLQRHTFDAAVFTSEKTEHIKQKLINTINKSVTKVNVENMSNECAKFTDWSSLNIMVVDDNEVNLRLAEIILRKHKSKVTTARSGVQALDYAHTNSFDIIFMDLHMPGMDGYETTKNIRKVTPGKQPVIIALTANALPQEKEKVVKVGMNGILIKPVSDAMLQKILNQWVMNSTTPKYPKASVISVPEFNSQNSADIPTNVAPPSMAPCATLQTCPSFLDIIAPPSMASCATLQTCPSFLDISSAKNVKVLDPGKNIFSIDLAKEFTGENVELAYELFSMLRAELDDYSKAISIAAKNNDIKKLLEQVHKLHGASRCCGTTELKNTSSDIENLINQNINFDVEYETRKLLIAIKNVKDYIIIGRVSS